MTGKSIVSKRHPTCTSTILRETHMNVLETHPHKSSARIALTSTLPSSTCTILVGPLRLLPATDAGTELDLSVSTECPRC